MVGNFIADFVRSSQIVNFPEKIKNGIKLHHEIDHFTDTHEVVKQSKNRLRTVYGKYSGVIVDVFYDHFLSVHWGKFSTQDRQTFCNIAYKNLNDNFVWMPQSLQEYLPEMSKRNWLYYYGEFEGVRRALSNLSNRSVHRKDLPQAIEVLQADYEGFSEDFLAFFPELHEHCNKVNFQRV
jgi:acyl carrier protein phosphodiesterase